MYGLCTTSNASNPTKIIEICIQLFKNLFQSYRCWSLYILHESRPEVFWRQQYPTVLLHKLREVAEQRVLFAEKIELVVSLFPHHQLVQEHGSVASNKLGCQLNYVTKDKKKIISDLKTVDEGKSVQNKI